eukprot:561291-Rhodomonas_salina.1
MFLYGYPGYPGTRVPVPQIPCIQVGAFYPGILIPGYAHPIVGILIEWSDKAFTARFMKGSQTLATNPWRKELSDHPNKSDCFALCGAEHEIGLNAPGRGQISSKSKTIWAN